MVYLRIKGMTIANERDDKEALICINPNKILFIEGLNVVLKRDIFVTAYDDKAMSEFKDGLEKFYEKTR